MQKLLQLDPSWLIINRNVKACLKNLGSNSKTGALHAYVFGQATGYSFCFVFLQQLWLIKDSRR